MKAMKAFCSLIVGLSLLVGSSASAATREQFDAQVVGIADGDTLTVLINGKERKVRLSGIDSPEKKQPFGNKAKQYTSEIAFGKTVHIEVNTRDRYGRSVAEVTLPDGRNLNDLILQNGYAWWYQKYSRQPHRETLEREARENGRGLWAEPRPKPPWEFRATKRSPATVSSAD